MGRPSKKGTRRQSREVAVSRIEEHHVDAFAEFGDEWSALAREQVERRLQGDGSALVAAVGAQPVALVGFRTADDGWTVDVMRVQTGTDGPDVGARLLRAVEELARPLGELGFEQGTAPGGIDLTACGYVGQGEAARLVKQLG
ncbi:hypothetical protein [Luteococcus sp. OSA5]|uniref:hypothetical protein n=1 Tax=Luteococcus sp. OSA5 TaxID=3401630 RepID=UPI003B433B23